MKWRLVITGDGPALSAESAAGDADRQAADVLGFFEGQKILGATFQVDSNNKDLLKEKKKADAKAAAEKPTDKPPEQPDTTQPV